MLKRREALKAKRMQTEEEDDTADLSGIPSGVYESDESDDEDSPMEAEAPAAETDSATPVAPRVSGMRKNRLLVLGSRGINARGRHLMTDFMALLPHTRKEAKLDSKDPIGTVNDLCELRSCTHAVFFDTRSRHRDLYFWAGRFPEGPTIKFFVENVHTMLEMNLVGNCLKGSRAVLSFDAAFDSSPLWRLSKEILTQVFAVPRGAPRSKPFIDHVFMFSIQDNRIWFRNYQIVEQGEKNADERSLIEIGPRFVLEPVRVFSGSFGGSVIFENLDFVAPNTVIRQQKMESAEEARHKKKDAVAAKKRKDSSTLPVNTIDEPFQ